MYIKIHLYLLLLIAYLFWKGTLSVYVVFYFCAFIHEVAHIVVALLLNVDVKELYLLPFGVSATILYEEKSMKEVLISMAGPLMSLLLIFLSKNIFLKTVNLSILLINMLPVFPLDGGRITRWILQKIFGNTYGRKISKIISDMTFIAFLCVAVMLLYLKASFYFMIFTLYLYSLFQNTMKKEILLNRIPYLQTDK